jgi:hypothetical protein
MATAPRLLTLCLILATAGGCSSLGPKAGAPTSTAAAAPPAAQAGSAAATPLIGQAGWPAFTPPAAPTPQPADAAKAPGSGATPSKPTGPPDFPKVIAGARRIDGPITAWQNGDKLWLELRPDQLGKPFLFTPKIQSGIGEGLLLGGLMTYPVAGAGGAQVVEFVRVDQTIRLQARNTEVSAQPGTPEARAVKSSYSVSLLGAAPVASRPHPDRKSVLIEANGMFLNDLAGIGMQLQRQYRQGYGLDKSNSRIRKVRGTPGSLIIETESHWFTGNVNSGRNLSPLAALVGAAAPTVPRFLPDTRSLLIGQHLSLVPLPDPPMATRAADARVGLFATRVLDFSDDLARTPTRRWIARWRLDKKDPAAAMSEPVKPITFWIDRNVPLAYRETVRSAILEWNKAFERIGFQQAIRVEQQPDNAKFDTLDPGYPSVRWLMSAEPGITAIGQTQLDPRTGEIVDVDISFEGLFTRAQRYVRSRLMAAKQAPFAAPVAMGAAPPVSTRGPGFEAAEAWGVDLNALLPAPVRAPADPAPDRGLSANAQAAEWCQYGDALAEQASYALDVMDARGELDPGSPEARQFVLDYVKDTVMHEVGHALGLRHNFRASRVYSEAQLADPEFTRTHGTTGSVMEYNAVNLASPGRHGGVPFQLTIGPYDYWAIEYAYKPAPVGASDKDVDTMLQTLAARSNEPLLAFGTDEDASFGIDAETIRFDLGADPLAFASKRLDIARDLFRRQESRQLPPDQDYAVLRRSLDYALGDATRALGVLIRQMGGLRTLRDHPGSGRDPIETVPTEVQRQAFERVVEAVFAVDGFRVSPALQRRLAPDYLDRGESLGTPTDYNLPQRLLALQRAVLAYLLSDQLADRLLDANDKLDAGAPTFTVAEIYQRLGRELWTELGDGAPVPLARRELQRDHVNRLAFAVLRPSPDARVDARGALRRQAQLLLLRLDATLARKGSKALTDEATRNHLADSADSLRQALSARLPRAGI